MRAVSSQRRELRECWTKTAALYASKTCEAAGVVIDTTFAKCVAQETTLREAVIAEAPYMRTGIQSLMDGFRDGGRTLMLPVILDERVEGGHFLGEAK